MSQESEVLIVGAGPTGLVLALQLAYEKVPFRIIDKAKGPGETSRAMLVVPRVLESYQKFGIVPEVIAGSIKIQNIHYHLKEKRKATIELGHIGRGKSAYPFILTYPQDVHEKVLLKKLQDYGIEVEWETELESLEDKGTHVEANVNNERENYSYVVGCDGASSQVRKEAGISFDGETYEEVFYVMDAELEGDLIEPDSGTFSFAGDNLTLFFPLKQSDNKRIIGMFPPEQTEENTGEETGDETETTDDNGSSDETASGDTVEITFWHAMNGPHQEAITALTDAFNESQDQYFVNEQGQGGYPELSQSIMGAGVSGDLPTMSQLTATDVPELASNDLLVPLTDDFLTSNGFEQEALDDIFEGFMTSSVYDGEMYAMPFSKSTRVMYYNQGILDEYDVELPTNWEEVEALGEMMVENGDDRVAMGLENGFEMEYETMARQNGADFIDGETLNVDINSAESVEALELLANMFEEGYARTAGEDGFFSGPFGRGESALYIGSSAGVAHVEPVAEEDGLDWGTAPIPTLNDTELTLFAGNDLALFHSASEEEQQGFVEYVNFLLQPENTAEWAMLSGYVPIRESALENEDYVAFLEENPQQEAATTMLSYGMSSPTFLGYGEFRNALIDAMDDVAVSGMAPQDVLDTLQQETESIIESNN